MRPGKRGLGLPTRPRPWEPRPIGPHPCVATPIGPHPLETTPNGSTPTGNPVHERPRPHRTSPMEDHAHWSPRPMEPRPQGWDHAHRVLSKEVQYSGARDTVPLTHQLCTLREVAPWGLSSLSRLGVCKALRSPLRSSPLRSQPLTFTTNHWANT